MSRTYRRLDDEAYRWVYFKPSHYCPTWEDSWRGSRGKTYEHWLNRYHSDNYDPCTPCKGWRRESHKIARARQRVELHKVMLDPEHDFSTELENEAHGRDLWDWY